VGNNDETPNVPDEAENQTTVEAEEDVEKDVAAKPEGGRIS
jgi:hypothetical protein